MIRALLVALLVACSRDTRRADQQGLVDSLQQLVRQDTSSDGYKQSNLMSAPIDVLPILAYESDTLQWVARSDSCAMVVRSFGPTGRNNGYGGGWVSVSEGVGSIGPGGSRDVSPSPDWKWLAYSSAIRVPKDSTRWKNWIEGASLSFDDVHRIAEIRPDGSRWVNSVIVEPGADGCMGEACPAPIVSPAHGWRIGWSADSRYLLLAHQADSLRWTPIDPKTRRLVAVAAPAPYTLNWATRAVADAMQSSAPANITGGGAYRFTTRGDSILVHGPDRNSRPTDRVVGPGVPVAVTRNGEYLLAVRVEKGRPHAVIYYFRLFHMMMRTSCDR